MEANTNETTSVALETIISNAVKLPGVNVNRKKFLAETFSNECENIQDIIDLGPVGAGLSQESINKKAARLIFLRTSQSSVASFVAGIPGGMAMAATIPADILQFFGMALRLAQELSYLYGADDIWRGGQLDDERVRNQLILYCGVMFGVSGAVSGVRVLSSQIAKTTIKQLPQKALTKTFWYPIIKQIGKAVGFNVTKKTITQGISKALPIVGGVISGSLNYASMMPMANRLSATLNKAAFDYSEEEYIDDIEIIESIDIDEEPTTQPGIFTRIAETSVTGIQAGWKKASSGATTLMSKLKRETHQDNELKVNISYDEKIDTVRKLWELVSEGILTQEEFEAKKKEILEL